MIRLAVLIALIPPPVSALSLIEPCRVALDSMESNMVATGMERLGGYGSSSGVVVESYVHANRLDPSTYEVIVTAAPLPQLEGFVGTRVTACATSDFIVVPISNHHEVTRAISATEFLRGRLQADERVDFVDVRRAAEAVYGQVLVLHETEETCGCSAYFPDLRPTGLTPFDQRVDQQVTAP